MVPYEWNRLDSFCVRVRLRDPPLVTGAPVTVTDPVALVTLRFRPGL